MKKSKRGGAYNGHSLYYWESNGKAENVQSKSLKEFMGPLIQSAFLLKTSVLKTI